MCTFSADRIVSGSDDNTIRIWDVKSGKCVKVLEGHSKVRTIIKMTIYIDICIYICLLQIFIVIDIYCVYCFSEGLMYLCS